jgi:phosphodiesterase/alkaline phosphatase D-like protein
MYVTWLTFNDTGDSFVDYGETELFGNRVMAEITSFRDSFLNSHKYTHRALIDGIKPGQKYYYRVGSQHAYSNIFSFTGLKERADGGYRFAVYGDFGLINARSLGLIQVSLGV